MSLLPLARIGASLLLARNGVSLLLANVGVSLLVARLLRKLVARASVSLVVVGMVVVVVSKVVRMDGFKS